MPAKKEFTPEIKEQAVRFVLDSIESEESRRRACKRLAPKLSMNPITLYAWVKASAPGPSRRKGPVGCSQVWPDLHRAIVCRFAEVGIFGRLRMVLLLGR